MDKDLEKALKPLLKNATSFQKKAHQIYPDCIVAFGIRLFSRYSKCDEVIAMLRFSQMAAEHAVAHMVHEVFFDSRDGVCSFKLDDSFVRGTDTERELIGVALATLGHFYWFDREYFRDSQD